MPRTVAVIDRTAAPPLWAQVEVDLGRRIAAGDLGKRFPTETELCAQYGVSRHTVREALRRMRTAGVLESTRGRGTRVVPGRIEQSLGALYSLFRSVEARGMVQRSIVLRLEVTADAAAAARLDLPAATELVVLERLRLADGAPLAHDEVHLPRTLADALLEADFTHSALYDELDRRCGVQLTGGQEEITAALGGPVLRGHLGVTDEPLLRVLRTGLVDGRVVETRVTHLRSDRFALVSSWARGGLGERGPLRPPRAPGA